MDKLANWLLATAVFLAPWGSVGVLHAVTGRSFGFGIQPAMLPLVLLILVAAAGLLRRRRLRPGEGAVVVAMLWTVAAGSLTWSLVDMGLAGDRPWAKSLKQVLQWGFFVCAALAVARTLDQGLDRKVERALALGLLAGCLVAIAAAFGGTLSTGANFLDTNPSIASGSDELYLGHSFTGISRLRAPMPEPLMFGSFLLAAVPLVALAGFGQRGFARWWRWWTALLGVACLLGTWSRGAWLGAAATVVVLAVLWWQGRFGAMRRRTILLLTTGAALVGCLAFSLALQVAPWDVPSLLVQRIGQSFAGHDMSNMTRVWAWRVAVEMFLQSPVYGQGWGSYGFEFFRYASPAASAAHFGWPVPNNLGLLLLAESGILGLGLWAIALGPALGGLVRRNSTVTAMVLAGASVGVLIQLSTFSQWNLPHLWLLFGAGLGMSRWPQALDGRS